MKINVTFPISTEFSKSYSKKYYFKVHLFLFKKLFYQVLWIALSLKNPYCRSALFSKTSCLISESGPSTENLIIDITTIINKVDGYMSSTYSFSSIDREIVTECRKSKVHSYFFHSQRVISILLSDIKNLDKS
jgi:hypothetical protein